VYVVVYAAAQYNGEEKICAKREMACSRGGDPNRWDIIAPSGELPGANEYQI